MKARENAVALEKPSWWLAAFIEAPLISNDCAIVIRQCARYAAGERPMHCLKQAANALRDMPAVCAIDCRFQAWPGCPWSAVSVRASRGSASPLNKPIGSSTFSG